MAENRSSEGLVGALGEVRSHLLRLHKALLESERGVYEQIYGPIPNRGEFFRLVIEHEWFNWLRQISQFIVQIDEFLASKEPMSADQADELLQNARAMLRPNSDGSALEQRYYHAIQRDPHIALMHAELSQLLASALD